MVGIMYIERIVLSLVCLVVSFGALFILYHFSAGGTLLFNFNFDEFYYVESKVFMGSLLLHAIFFAIIGIFVLYNKLDTKLNFLWLMISTLFVLDIFMIIMKSIYFTATVVSIPLRIYLLVKFRGAVSKSYGFNN